MAGVPIRFKETVYQPEYDEPMWTEKNSYSFMVYPSRERARRDFPDLKISEVKVSDVEEPTFVDCVKET